MSKKIRDYLFILFIVLFIGLTILISLYASGYKINFSLPLKFNKLLIKTGMLVMDTTPNGAVIYLNDELQKTSGLTLGGRDSINTPAKIKNMLPGAYNVRLEKKGYWPIKKRVKIESGQTTFIEDITLFKINEPLKIVSAGLGRMEISPNYKYILLLDDKKIINLKNNQEILLNVDTIQNWQWMKGDSKLLINDLVINPENGDVIIDYSKIIGSEATAWLWDESDNSLYYKNKYSLNHLESDGKTNITIIDGEHYSQYYKNNNYIYFISNDNRRVQLKEYSESDHTIISNIVLPNNGDYRFITDNNPYWLPLYDIKNHSLQLFQFNRISENNLTIRNIKSWHWLNSYQLVYSNNLEIYIFDTRKNSSTLITRLGENIQNIIYNNNENYLIVTTDKSIKAIDFRDDNITTIFRNASEENILTSVLNDRDNNLYFITSIKGESGIYKILVR